MILALVCVASGVAAVIQRLTGMAFILVLIGPAVLAYGAVEGVTVAVLLAVIASLAAVPSSWRLLDRRRVLWLLGIGIAATPFGAMMPRILPEPALLFVIAAMAAIALLAPLFSTVTASKLRGRQGLVIAGAAAGFMHASSGLSGPALAAYAVGDRWEQRSFAASAQVVLLGYGLVSVALRGLPSEPLSELVVLAVCTGAGILLGSVLVDVVPAALARTAMICCAWAGTAVIVVRAFLALIA